MALQSQDMAFGFGRHKVQSRDTLNCVGKHLRAFDAINAQRSPAKWAKVTWKLPALKPTYKVHTGQRLASIYKMNPAYIYNNNLVQLSDTT
jgi:hypothetical protein